MEISKDKLEYIKDQAAAYGEDYKEVLARYIGMANSNFEQDIHDIINSMDDEYL